MAYGHQVHTPSGYKFPSDRLTKCLKNRAPLVLLACGSFSPITKGMTLYGHLFRPIRSSAHLEMFDIARDYAASVGFEVVGGVVSPVSDGYKKQGLAPAHHRIEMCKLAAEEEYDWLTVDPWEAKSPTTIPTAQVLDHVDYEINEAMGGIECDDETKRHAKIVLLAGLDLVQTMSTPGVWEKRDLDHILGRYGLFALERQGTETEPALASLEQWRHNIHILRKHVTEDISSTKTRLLLKQDVRPACSEVKKLDQEPNGDRSSSSLEDMIPNNKVRDYIYRHNLYRGSSLDR